MFWSLEEWLGKKKGGKKDKKEKSKGTCVEEKKRGKKKRKKERKKCRVWRIKKEGEKMKKRIIKYYHNFFTILSQLLLANIGKKKIIFLEREKHNFNSTLKLKSISIFITIFS